MMVHQQIHHHHDCQTQYVQGLERIVFDSRDDDEFADAPSLQRTQQAVHQESHKLTGR